MALDEGRSKPCSFWATSVVFNVQLSTQGTAVIGQSFYNDCHSCCCSWRAAGPGDSTRFQLERAAGADFIRRET